MPFSCKGIMVGESAPGSSLQILLIDFSSAFSITYLLSAALITPGGDPVSLCILTIPLYILYEFAILFGSFIERNKAIRAWNEWDESIQGAKPAKPKADKLSTFLLILTLVLLCGAATLAWVNQDKIKESLHWFDFVDEGKDQVTKENNQTLPLPYSRNSNLQPTGNQSMIINFSIFNLDFIFINITLIL